MNKFIFALLLFTSCKAFSQKDPTTLAQPIVEEGKRLYRSEMASWYGTDLFIEFYQNKEKIGGYLSYAEEDKTKCIFFSKDEDPRVIGTLTFDSTFNTKAAKIDLTERKFTDNEDVLYKIRTTALKAINADTMFIAYENTNFNLIPLISNNEKKVYVLTGPQESGVVIFGNDYLLNFDNNNKLVSKKRLHNNIIPLPYEGSGDEKEIEGTVHSHLPETGDFITATDVCTLMLYGKFTKWKQHSVISKKYLNIWSCETNQLTVITTEALEKITGKQKGNKSKK